MPKRTFRIPYGESSLEFSVPGSMRASVAASREVQPVADAREAVDEALADPIGVPRVREMANATTRACIVFTDITRASPDETLVAALLRELEAGGVRDENITLLCGTGMHRPSTVEEKVIKLGAEIAARYRVIDNEAQNASALVDLGKTAGGAPVQLHRAAVEADLLMATGVVEPHQYAGYSGGSKTAAIGAAGEALIAHTHGPAFVDHPGTRLGRIDGNPFHDAVVEAGRMAGLRFIVNVVLDENKRVLRVGAGDPELAFDDLVGFARSVYEVPIPQQYDVAIGGVGAPKDANLYQASRAPSYLFFAPTPVVRRGGMFIIPAKCEEGAGSGVGEQRFFAAMRDAPSVQDILADARSNGYPPGQQRAFVMAKVLEACDVVIVGSDHPELVAECKMIPAATMDEAMDLATARLGASLDVLIVPHAMLTLPVVQEGAGGS